MLGQNDHLKDSDIKICFVQEYFKKQPIYDIIKRYEIGLPAEDLHRIGRPSSFNGKIFKRLKNIAANSIGVSQLKLGKKIGVA